MRDTSPRLRATPAARSQASSILSAAATGLVSFILLEGGDPDRVLGLAGVSATALGQPASSLGLDLYCRVMEQAAADTCNGNFGLRYGQQYDRANWGCWAMSRWPRRRWVRPSRTSADCSIITSSVPSCAWCASLS